MKSREEISRQDAKTQCSLATLRLSARLVFVFRISEKETTDYTDHTDKKCLFLSV